MENREIPKGWRETTLGEIVDLKTGRLNSNAAVEGGQYPFFTCSPTTFKINDYAFDTEALLLAGNNANAIYTLKYYKGKFNAYQRTYVITIPNDKIADYKYLYYRLNLKLNYLKDISQGSATKFLTVVILREMELTLPPYEEQVAIGQVLSSLDEKIELLEEENRILETLAQTIFTEWFVNFNFPGATGEMEDSELGEIPKGWRVVELRELVSKLSKGTTPKQSSDEIKTISFLKVKDITDNGDILINTVEKISEQTHLTVLNRSILEEDDILFSIAGTIGRVAIVPKYFNNANCNQAIAFVRLSDKELLLEYIHLWIRTDEIRNKINASIVQGVQANVSLTVLGALKMAIPESNILKIWKEIIAPMYNKLKNSKEQIQTLKTTRDTLLPKLTTGEIRVEGFGE